MITLRRLAARGLWASCSLLFTAVLVMAVVYVYMELQLPNVDTLRDVHLQVPLRIYTSDNKLMAQFGTKRRIPVKLAQVPKKLIQAVLATEDARFYDHPGVDIIGIIRAAKAVIISGKRTQGASTITMQVARNFFLSRKKTYSRKINEILLALKIDKELSKNKILELYLNKIYFGHRAYGVAAAAKVYYGETLDQLTLPQIAMIAGLPQAPSRNNPLSRPQAALKRRNHVLGRMLDVGFITQAEYKAAIKAPMTAKYHAAMRQVDAPYAAEMVREAMVDEYGDSAYDKGLTVYTTISATTQNQANRALRDGLMAYSNRHGFRKPSHNLSAADQSTWAAALKKHASVDGIFAAAVTEVNDQSIQALLATGKTITIHWAHLKWARRQLDDGYVGRLPKTASDIVKVGDVIQVMQARHKRWALTQIPEVQGALIAVNPQNGAITALIGGFNYQHSNFNRAIQAERQPGSNFKPFIYSAALAKGYTLASIINDAPVVMRDTGENELWRPMNDTRKFYGPTPLRIGLIKSRNLVSVRLLQAIGVPYAIDYIKRFGFDANTLPHTLSLALGSGSVTPMQIVNGYAVFANGGSRINPYFVQLIKDQHDDILFRAKPVQACASCITADSPAAETLPNPMAPRVITPQNAYLITQALRGVIRSGTGRAARVLKRPDLAGKTGTTNNQVDAWFSGFNSHLAVTVWVGFDNLRSLHEYGAQAALPIWIQFMRQALRHTTQATMPEPSDMVMVRINPKTGELAGPGDPNAKFEIFRKSYAPTHVATTSPSDAPPAAAAATSASPAEEDQGDEHLF